MPETLFMLESTLPSAIESSAALFKRAVSEFNPTNIVSMVSGGGDSSASDAMTDELGIKVDLRIHGRTGTGIPETTQWCADYYGAKGEFTIADAGDAYERYVMRKGFFGTGRQAHNFAYRILKADPFRATISRELRKRKRDVRVLLINGARKYESDNRRLNMPPMRFDGKRGNLWLNLCHEWSDTDKAEFLQSRNVERNPVLVQLCRSGECMCGTMQSEADFAEAAILYPKWGCQMRELRRVVTAKFGFDWGQPHPKPVDPDQLTLDFQPMCGNCLRREEAT